MSHVRMVYVVISLTVFLLITIYLRSSNTALFYQWRKERVEQDRLKQQLWEQQVLLDSIVSQRDSYKAY